MPRQRVLIGLLLLLAALLLWLTVTGCRLGQALEGAHVREQVTRRELAAVQTEHARLQAVLGGVARRPERVLALALQVDLERDLGGLINADRVALGRRPLAWDEQLAFLAQWRASDLHTRAYYSHTFPEGGNIGTLLASYGGFNTLTGENLWSCASWLECDAASLHRAFVGSPGHRANQEDAQYDHFGLGVSLSPEGNLFIVELFSNQRFGYRAPVP